MATFAFQDIVINIGQENDPRADIGCGPNTARATNVEEIRALREWLQEVTGRLEGLEQELEGGG